MDEKKIQRVGSIKRRFLVIGALVVLLVVVVLSIMQGLDTSSTIEGTNEGDTPPIGDTDAFKAFNDCLAENGVVIYGSRFCSTCNSFVEELGGYEAVAAVYIECADEPDICNAEMQTEYVPEIQMFGEVYDGSRDISTLSDITGCSLPE